MAAFSQSINCALLLRIIARKSAVRQTIKAARTAPKGDKAALAAAYKAIDKALKRGIIKKNTAARRKAKVSKMLKA